MAFVVSTLEAYGVHAVPLSGLCRPVVEYVPEVRIAHGAYRLDPSHSERVVNNILDRSRQCLVEARPPGARVELCVGIEEGVPACGALVKPVLIGMDQLSREGTLRSFFSEHAVLLWRQLVLEFLLVFRHGVVHVFWSASIIRT